MSDGLDPNVAVLDALRDVTQDQPVPLPEVDSQTDFDRLVRAACNHLDISPQLTHQISQQAAAGDHSDLPSSTHPELVLRVQSTDEPWPRLLLVPTSYADRNAPAP